MSKFIEAAEPFWKDTNIRPNEMEEVDYGDEDMVESSAASQQAKAQGLQHMGFGRYGKSGKVQAITRGGKLVPVAAKPAGPSTSAQPQQGPKAEPGVSIAKKGSRPAMSFEPTRDEKRDFEVKFIDALNGLQFDNKGRALLSDLVSKHGDATQLTPDKAHAYAKKITNARDAAQLYLGAEQGGAAPEATQVFYQRARDLAFMKHFGKEPQAAPAQAPSAPSAEPPTASAKGKKATSKGLQSLDNKIWDKLGVEDGGTLYQKHYDKYLDVVDKAVPKGTVISQKTIDDLENENYHALIQALHHLGRIKYGSDDTHGLAVDPEKRKHVVPDNELYNIGARIERNAREGNPPNPAEVEKLKNHLKIGGKLPKAWDEMSHFQDTKNAVAKALAEPPTRQATKGYQPAGQKDIGMQGRLQPGREKTKKPPTPQVPTGAAGATPLGMKPQPDLGKKVPAKAPSTAPTPKAVPKATPATSLKRGGKTGSRPAMSGPQPDKAQKRDFEVKFVDIMNQVKPDQTATQEIQRFMADQNKGIDNPHDFAQTYTNATKAAKAYAAAEDAPNPDQRLAQELYKRTRDLAYLQHFGKTGQAKTGAAPQAPAKAPAKAPSAPAKSEPIKGSDVAKQFDTLPDDVKAQIADLIKKQKAVPPKKAEPETPPAQSQAKSGVKRVAAPGTPERQKQIEDLAFHTSVHHTSPLNAETLQKLDELGFQVEKPLGSGTRGTAYLLANGRVLKATNDRAEVIASSLLSKHPHPSFPKMGKTFALKGVQTAPQHGRYSNREKKQMFIEQEYLEPIPSQYRPEVKGGTKEGSQLIGGIADLSLIYQAQNSPDFESPNQVLKLFGTDDLGTKKRQRIAELMATGDKAMNQKMFMSIMKGIQHLNKLGVKYGDVWHENLRTDKRGNPKIIDVGYTVGQGLKKKRVRQLEDWWKYQ